MEVRFRESNGDQGREEAVLRRTREEGGQGLEDVEVLHKLFWYYGNRAELPLMLFQAGQGCKVWTRGQATYCLRRGL